MAQPPSTFELEAAAQALRLLTRRASTSWSDTDFIQLMPNRQRGSCLLASLEQADLLVQDGCDWRLTADGLASIVAINEGRWDPFATAMLGTGLYGEELARLLEAGAVVGATLHCPIGRVRHVAPVAGTILSWVPRYRDAADLVVPLSDLEALLAAAAMDQAAKIPNWVIDNNSVGWRAELYSLRSERALHGVEKVLHTAQDAGDGFGYDIEVTASSPSRLIEVKGSRSDRVSFTLTSRELETARAQTNRYELQFWGGISLAREPREEYRLLREVGYPWIYRDVGTSIDSGGWSLKPRSWKVEIPPAGG